MVLGNEDSCSLAAGLLQKHPTLQKCNIWLTPSFTGIREASRITGDNPYYKIGAQNAHWEDKGAFTGEVSCSMLKDCGAHYVIIGHSERRHIFHESIEMVNMRAARVLASEMKLIFCIGESLSDREKNLTENILSHQLSMLPSMLMKHPANEAIIAYEPVWAIGTGKVAGTDEIAQAHDFIKTFWSKNSSIACPKILYGGSVNCENLPSILKIESVSGALIGGASSNLESFSAIISAAENSA